VESSGLKPILVEHLAVVPLREGNRKCEAKKNNLSRTNALAYSADASATTEAKFLCEMFTVVVAADQRNS